MKINQSQINNLTEWQYKELGELLDYEQPTNYIVDSEDYRDHYPTPVLTAGKTFILGYTDENFGVYQKLPVIIFDDFTTAHKFVDFPFKVKSSAMKILKAKKNVNIKFIYGWMQSHPYIVGEHKRNYLSEYQFQDVLLPSFSEQNRIVSVLETWDKAIEKLSKKIEVKKQIKKGLIQDLLTGKKRLRRFSKKWETKTISEICNKENSDVSVNTLDFNSGKYPVYGASGFIKNIDFFTQNKPYISIVKDGAGVGRLTLHKEKTSVLGTLNILHANNNNNLNFLYFLMHTIDFKKYITGSTIPHIYYKDYKKHKVLIPELKEQIEIAKIISTADQEIVVSENKLKLLKEQKRYLLNNLITGKIRTPETLSRKLIK